MSLPSIRRAHDAGYRAGWRDAKDGRPVGLFAEQRSSPFAQGYQIGYREALVGGQETWSDIVSDLVLAYETQHGGGDDDGPA